MKAIIYCRVSTKEQAEQGYSLEGQEKDCRKFALDEGYEVVSVFVERGESAKTQDRTQLRNLIQYSFQHKNSLSALIIWKYDRLARNLSDQMELVRNFSSLGIRILSVTENNEDTSVGKLMRNIIGSFAQYENDIKSERTKNGMRQAIQKGRWCWRAPIGYKLSRDDSGKPILVPSQDSEHIKEAFRLAESGLYAQAEICEKMKSKGLNKLTLKPLGRVLRNPLYAGLIKHDWFPDYIQALHLPLVSKDTFFKVQLLLDGKRPIIAPRARNNPDFPLRNFVTCPRCGRRLTGSWSTGKMGKKYPYYHCRSKGCSLIVRKHTLENLFYDFLKYFQPTEEVLKLFERTMIDEWKRQHIEHCDAQSRIEKELLALEQTDARVFELLVKGTITDDVYKKRIAEIKNQALVKKIELNECTIELNDIEACLNYCAKLLTNLARLWAICNLEQKQRLQAFIFPEGIKYDGEACRTPVTAIIIKQLHSTNLPESHMVAPTGVEPVSHG